MTSSAQLQLDLEANWLANTPGIAVVGRMVGDVLRGRCRHNSMKNLRGTIC